MQITPGIHSLEQDKGGNVHAFLLDDGQGLTLIDTLYDDDGSVVLAEIAAMGRKPADLKQDHTHACAQVAPWWTDRAAEGQRGDGVRALVGG
jgi:hypothetical protein